MRNKEWLLLFGVLAGFTDWPFGCAALVGLWACLTLEEALSYYTPKKESDNVSCLLCGMKQEGSALTGAEPSSKLSTTEQQNVDRVFAKWLHKNNSSRGMQS